MSYQGYANWDTWALVNSIGNDTDFYKVLGETGPYTPEGMKFTIDRFKPLGFNKEKINLVNVNWEEVSNYVNNR